MSLKITAKGILCFVAVASVLSSVAHAGKLKVLALGIQKDVVDKVVSEYTKSHKTTSFTTVVGPPAFDESTLSSRPDVVLVFWGFTGIMGSVADIGLFADLNKLLSKDALKDVMSTCVDAFRINKSLLAVPIGGVVGDLRYNIKTFANSGLAEPSGAWSWDREFYNACLKLSKDTDGDGVVDHWGVTGLPNIGYSSAIYSRGGSIFDKTLTKLLYTKKPAIEAIDFVTKMHKEKLAEIYDWSAYDATNAPFTNGMSAMTFGTGIGQQELPYKEILVKAAPMPIGIKGSVPPINPYAAAVMSNSSNKKEAVEFVSYLMSAQGQSIFCQAQRAIPISYSTLKQKWVADSLTPPFLKSYQAGRGRSFRTKDIRSIEDYMWTDVLKLISGEISKQEFVTRASEYEKMYLKTGQYVLYK